MNIAICGCQNECFREIEVNVMFHNMVQDWFATFSYFDTREWVSEKSESERFIIDLGWGLWLNC